MTNTFRLAVALAAMTAGPLAAQCENGRTYPDLGLQGFSCRNCQINVDDVNGVRSYRFGTELTLGRIRPGGPTAGVLRDGDVVVAVDGAPITTAEGGRRFAALRPGRAATFTVRRDGRNRDVTVTPGEQCRDALLTAPPRPPMPPRAAMPPAPPSGVRPPMPPTPPSPASGAWPPPMPPRAPQAPAAPRPPRAPQPPRAPRPPQAPQAPRAPLPPVPPMPPAPAEFLPDGWFGFGIGCRSCEIRNDNGVRSFTFRSPPSVETVEDGTPAARAGLRRGDRLTHIDGLALTTPQAWRRFGAIKPGERVEWTYTRDGRARTAPMQALRRPDAGTRPRAAAASQRLRYSGAVGDAEVEVRGAPVTVTRDERTGETVIRSADLTVRIRPER